MAKRTAYETKRRRKRIIWTAIIGSNLALVLLTVHGFDADCVSILATTVIHDWVSTLL